MSAAAGLGNWWLGSTLKPITQLQVSLTDTLRQNSLDIRELRGSLASIDNEVSEPKRFRRKWYKEYQVLVKDQHQTDRLDSLEKMLERIISSGVR